MDRAAEDGGRHRVRSLGGWQRGGTGFEAHTVINGDDTVVHVCHSVETVELAEWMLETFPVEMNAWLDRVIAARTQVEDTADG
jgi:hypothetical protein